MQQCLKKANQAQEGQASSTRSRSDEHIDKVSAKRLTRHTVGVDTTDDGLSLRRRSHGSDRSDPRRDARDESAVRADDEDARKA